MTKYTITVLSESENIKFEILADDVIAHRNYYEFINYVRNDYGEISDRTSVAMLPMHRTIVVISEK